MYDISMKNVDSIIVKNKKHNIPVHRKEYKLEKQELIEFDISKVFLILIILMVFLTFWLFYWSKLDQYDSFDVIMTEVPNKCAKGEWIEFPTKNKNINNLQPFMFSGYIFFEDGIFRDIDKENIFSVDLDYSLSFFDGRQIQIDGFKINESTNKQYIYVKRIKCLGREANAVSQQDRQKKMEFIMKNKEDIFGTKVEDRVLNIEDISFVNDDIAYVYFTFKDEGDDNSRIILINIINNEDEFKFEKMAMYIFEDNRFILAEGDDQYKNTYKNVYEYDKHKKEWVFVW